jgi:hypothetical protein
LSARKDRRKTRKSSEKKKLTDIGLNFLGIGFWFLLDIGFGVGFSDIGD